MEVKFKITKCVRRRKLSQDACGFFFFFKCVRFYVRVLSVLSKAKYVFNVGLAKKISNSLSKKLNVN